MHFLQKKNKNIEDKNAWLCTYWAGDVASEGSLKHQQHPMPSKHLPILAKQTQWPSNYLKILTPNFGCPTCQHQISNTSLINNHMWERERERREIKLRCLWSPKDVVRPAIPAPTITISSTTSSVSIITVTIWSPRANLDVCVKGILLVLSGPD